MSLPLSFPLSVLFLHLQHHLPDFIPIYRYVFTRRFEAVSAGCDAIGSFFCRNAKGKFAAFRRYFFNFLEFLAVGSLNRNLDILQGIAITIQRRAANQAWFEFMPADVNFDEANTSFQNIKLYRDFQFGQLMSLVMTDQRLYRS